MRARKAPDPSSNLGHGPLFFGFGAKNSGILFIEEIKHTKTILEKESYVVLLQESGENGKRFSF